MQPSDIKPNVIVQGPIFPERVKVITSIPMGDSIKLIGEGMETGKVHQPVLNEEQIAELEVSSEKVFFHTRYWKMCHAIFRYSSSQAHRKMSTTLSIRPDSISMIMLRLKLKKTDRA